MSVVEVLGRMGGVATRAALIRATSRAAVDAALACGAITAVARGRYALASADEALVAAHRLSGVVSHESAAIHHGWQVRLPPDRPHVTLAKGRAPAPERRRGVEVHRIDLGPDDVVGIATSPERTLADCLRTGSFADGLCVADSALRDGFAPGRLRAMARDARGPGSARIRRVAACADGRAANAFESALRAVALQVPGLCAVPQVALRARTFLGRPDLVDERLGIVIEADSFAWHGDRAALARDARRYNRFAVHGWLVLRFTWEDVMFQPHEVELVLKAAVAERTERRCRCGTAA
ncbi:hypothetical protein [Nocardioides coralli]|uniref:hypothetical protein n=1 Tax=Nocardioides coralli TaxID=2872154 RepID=UPI001CA46A29|nr:hypothetical protein [Nocardioides coralli]QZY29643.1 hypothetical protein K6T13_02820 [Nocardioides coralli]